MRKQVKRDPENKAYHQGYKAGIRGHSDKDCPYSQAKAARGAWYHGYREGHEINHNGYFD